MTSFSISAGGVFARTVVLKAPPMGPASHAAHEFAERLKAELLANHGHAGPAFVRWLMLNKAKAPLWRARFIALQEEHQGKVAATSGARRALPYIALIHLAMELVEQALGIPQVPKVLDALRQAADEAGEGVDRAAAALHDVRAWAAERQHDFDGRQSQVRTRDGNYDDRDPNRYMGAWKRDETTISFLPTVLRRALEELGYEAEATLSSWHQRGWLKATAGKRTYPVTVGGVQARCNVLLGPAPSSEGA